MSWKPAWAIQCKTTSQSKQKMMLTHYYINESWKTSVNWKKTQKATCCMILFYEMSRDRKIDGWLGRRENEVQMVTGFLFGMIKTNLELLVLAAHSGYTKTSELYILRVNILWYVSCTNTQKGEEPTWQNRILQHRFRSPTESQKYRNNCNDTWHV